MAKRQKTKNGPRKVNISFAAEKDLYLRIRAESKRRGQTASQFMRQVIQDELDTATDFNSAMRIPVVREAIVKMLKNEKFREQAGAWMANISPEGIQNTIDVLTRDPEERP